MAIGRPRKLNEEVIKKFCEARQIGSSVEVSALYAGVSDTVIKNWINRGRELQATRDAGERIPARDKIFVAFLEQVEEADANAAISWQQVVDKAASVDPNWAFRMLKLRFPGGYTEIDTVNVNQTTVSVSVSADDLAHARDKARAFEDDFLKEEGG